MLHTLNYNGFGLPYAVTDTLDKLVAEVDRLTDALAVAQQQLAAQPPPLTLQQISVGLSAKGAAPLNLTGLPGK